MRITEQAIGELNALAGRTGKLTPEQVVEAAKNPKSPLHDCFTWDNNAAAEKWRIEEARELIRSVRIEVTVEERTIRTVAYVRDPEKDAGESGYVAAMKVRKSSVGALLNSELAQIAALLERAAGIARTQDRADLADRLDGLRTSVDGLKGE